jgi:hypothetical protein
MRAGGINWPGVSAGGIASRPPTSGYLDLATDGLDFAKTNISILQF